MKNALNEPPELLQPAVHEQGNTESVCLSVAHRAFTETQSVQNLINQSHCEKHNEKYSLGYEVLNSEMHFLFISNSFISKCCFLLAPFFLTDHRHLLLTETNRTKAAV